MSRRKPSTGVEPQDELTEITKAEIVRVDGVLGPANGTPPLLMKSLPDDGHGAALAEELAKKKGPDGSKPDKAPKVKDDDAPDKSKPPPRMPAGGSQDDGIGDQVDGPEGPVGKAQLSSAEMNDLPDSAFAYIEPGGTKDAEGKTVPRENRHFAIHDKAHADNAAARIAQGAKFGEHALPKVKAAQRKFGTAAVEKAAVDLLEGGAGLLGYLNGITRGRVEKAEGDDQPGSPAWEAQDAALLRTAASQLADLRARVANSRDREAQEEESYDWDNASDLDCAVQAIECALGIVARLAFTEAVESYASDDMAKAGRRLSGKSIAAIKTARDHLTDLLGPDGEEPKEEETEVTKAELDAALEAAVAKGREQTLELLAGKKGKVRKAYQAGTPTGAPTTPPEPAGADLQSGTGETDAEANRQGSRLPGMNPVPEQASTPALGGEPGGGLPAGEKTGSGSTAEPASGDMARVKAAETASDANPPLVKSTDQGKDTEALVKSLLEPVMKSVQEAVRPLEEGLEAVRKQVKEIAEAPMPGGPLLKGAPGQQFDYLVRRPYPAAPEVPSGADAGELLKAVDSIEDPVARAQITRALAVRTHPALQRT